MSTRVSTRTSTCVDCTTPIIGDRLRCPACHDRHAADFSASDDATTLPRDRIAAPVSLWQALVAWLVLAQVFAVVVILLILAGRNC